MLLGRWVANSAEICLSSDNKNNYKNNVIEFIFMGKLNFDSGSFVCIFNWKEGHFSFVIMLAGVFDVIKVWHFTGTGKFT